MKPSIMKISPSYWPEIGESVRSDPNDWMASYGCQMGGFWKQNPAPNNVPVHFLHNKLTNFAFLDASARALNLNAVMDMGLKAAGDGTPDFYVMGPCPP